MSKCKALGQGAAWVCLLVAVGCGTDQVVAGSNAAADAKDSGADLALSDGPGASDQMSADSDATAADSDIVAEDLGADATTCTAASCDDGNPCTDDHCDGGKGCWSSNNAAACDDANACTKGDVCAAGACTPGAALECDDKNACTKDACNLATGCTATAQEGACDDGDGCTNNDTCQNGKCGTGAALTCDDSNPCTSDTCDPAKGCAFVANTAPCTDGSDCSSGDACKDGACQPGAAKACNDGNPCTSDSCDGASGACLYAASTATCDDGDACTSGDACIGAVCAGKQTCSCATAADCDDKNACTLDTCEGGACGYLDAAADATCTDGNGCTTGDTCSGGTCAAGAALDCDDKNGCTTDSCVPGIGCVHAPNALGCDDGNALTLGDACQSGACVGLPASCTNDSACSDGNACTDDACVTGACAHKPAGAGKACEDGNGCTIGDSCLSAACLPGVATSCDDANACTDDACDPGSGACKHSANTSPCNDGDACTTQDACAAGGCIGSAKLNCDDAKVCTDDACNPASGCTHTDNTAPCEDGNACTTNDTCAAGACLGGAAPDCNDKNVCTDDSCNIKNGCEHVHNTAPCDDGSLCTQVDTCVSGACFGTSPKDCKDGKPCTDDACDPMLGCTNPGNSAACDDGDACTTADTCANGLCVGGAAPVCDDQNPCTTDGCDSKLGCVHTALDNGTVCGVAACSGLYHSDPKTCFSGICLDGAKTACDDSNLCTTDACDLAQGCTHTDNALICEDGSQCTLSDACLGGSCVGGSALSCDDQNACSVDSCDPQKGCQHADASDGTLCIDASCTAGIFSKGSTCKTGTCIAIAGPISCNDNNACTDDACTPTAGCSHTDNSASCSDDNACTSGDACLNGVCMAGKPVTCSPSGNSCVDNKCDMLQGCIGVNNALACDDSSVCTTGDACTGGNCSGAKVNCDDSNACTDDSCDPKSGCAHSNNDVNLCSDGNPCTTTDFCQGGACKGTGGPNCDDANPCTADTCDPLDAGKCKHPNAIDGTTCGTGACLGADFQGPPTCLAGVCAAAPAAVTCDDANSCTTDICNAAQGCLHPGNTSVCNDNSLCTLNDACAGGVCGGTALGCEDNNACTDDSCDPKTGCVHDFNSAPCSDGNACTTKDQCGSGACVGATPLDCDDKNDCTTDSCAPGSGCVHMANTAACEDGNACTTGDVCAAKICVAGAALVCSDGKVCTNDACDPLKGCVTTDNTAPCDDGKPCTSADTCAAGVCVGGPATVCDDKNPCTVDSCDPAKGCVAVAGNDTTPCSAGACPTALSYTAPGSCLAGQCAVPATKSCNDAIDCTADSCVAATGCVNTTKAWGTTCTPAAGSGLYYPFCAGNLCTGVEPKVTQPSATVQRSMVTGIDRIPGGSIYTSGWDSGLGFNIEGNTSTVVETPLNLTANSLLGVQSRLLDVRQRLAVGGLGNGGNGNGTAVIWNGTATAPNWTPTGAPNLGFTAAGINAVDMSMPTANVEAYTVAGNSDQTRVILSNIARTNFTTSFGPVTRMAVAQSDVGTCNQVALDISDVYQASDTAIFFAGVLPAGNGTAAQSAVAYYGGNSVNNCDGDTGFTGLAYTASPSQTQNFVAPINSGANPPVGQFRAVHGSSSSNVLVGGSAGTLFSYNGTTWTQQVPAMTGLNSAYDVRSVFVSGSEAWVGGEINYATVLPGIGNTACRALFLLHGVQSAGTWSWNKLIATTTDMTVCGTNLDYARVSKVWVDASNGSVYVGGSTGTNAFGQVSQLNPTQQRQVILRIKTK